MKACSRLRGADAAKSTYQFGTLHLTSDQTSPIFSIGRKVLTAQKRRGGFNFDIYVIYVSLICGRGLSAMLLRMAKKAVVGSMVRLARQWRASGCRRTASRIYNLYIYDINLNQNTTVCTAKFDEQFVMLIPKNVARHHGKIRRTKSSSGGLATCCASLW